MASTQDEKNQKNARILQTNVFSRDLISLVRHSLRMFDPKKHSWQFLYDTIEFNHIMLNMLNEYSKGKVMTVETNKTRRVKKNT